MNTLFNGFYSVVLKAFKIYVHTQKYFEKWFPSKVVKNNLWKLPPKESYISFVPSVQPTTLLKIYSIMLFPFSDFV